jgi:5-methylcytosine-specific restriction enzyme A
MPDAVYATALRLALEGSTKLQRNIAAAFLEKSDHSFLHKELAAHLKIAQATLNVEFGKLGHRVYAILNRHPDGLQPSEIEYWASELVEFDKSDDGLIYYIARKEFIEALESIFMDEVETGSTRPGTFSEGGSAKRKITIFERSRAAREACLKEFGARCCVCQFDFGERYGSEFRGKMHVHHITCISSRKNEYEIDPKQELRPVCPNCHYVLHLKDPPYTVEEVHDFIRNSQKNTKRRWRRR